MAHSLPYSELDTQLAVPFSMAPRNPTGEGRSCIRSVLNAIHGDLQSLFPSGTGSTTGCPEGVRRMLMFWIGTGQTTVELLRRVGPESVVLRPDPGEMLVALRAFLSTTVTDLAEVLQVERPTVYAWLARTAKPRRQNLERLSALYEVSTYWRDLAGDRPAGALVRRPFSDGVSLFDLLRSESIQTADVHARLRQLVGEAPQGRALRTSVRDLMKSAGFPAPAGGAGQDRLDLFTGRRIGPE